MEYREMEESDFYKVIEIYMDYYNSHEGGSWTYETAYRHIHPVWAREGAYCLVAEAEGRPVGFALGYFVQYDDLAAYELDEIVLAYGCQNKGLGTEFLHELEQRVKEKGAPMIQLKAVNDEMHERFYGKNGYRGVENFVLKAKWL